MTPRGEGISMGFGILTLIGVIVFITLIAVDQKEPALAVLLTTLFFGWTSGIAALAARND